MVQAFDICGVAATVAGGDMDMSFGCKTRARAVRGGNDKGAVWEG